MASEASAAAGKIVEVKLPDNPWWRYSCGDGSVTISAPPGSNITNERAGWLLDRAKASLLRDNP